ncbi:MAG: hypothetical protein ACOYXT_11950 [Bacteroidota bacterium]
MNFEDFLLGKKIDTAAFSNAEPALWKQWKAEFDQMHPNSFTVQKLNLINPIRRKYPLKEPPPAPAADQPPVETPMAHQPGRPVIKPKPKFN